MSDPYVRKLKKILTDTSVPDGLKTISREEIERGIAEISDRLRGPLNNVERLWLVEDRQHLRNQLAQLGD